VLFGIISKLLQSISSQVPQSSLSILFNKFNNNSSHIALISMIAPFSEEFLFRGYMYPALRARLNCFSACLIVILFSACLHFGPVSQSLGRLLSLIVFNVLLCVIREQKANLFLCIAVHFGHNFGVVLLSYFQS